MTKYDARKKQIRTRMAATGEPYSVAARAIDQAAEPEPTSGPAIQITTISLTPPPVTATWQTPRLYRCHHCGAAGELTRSVAADSSVSFVLQDGSTYVLAHCPACLPKAKKAEGERWTEADSERSRRSWELVVAARDAMRAGQAPGARDTDLYRCSVCGGAWQVDPRITLPAGVLLDTSTDLYMHPCPYCWSERGPQACGEAHRECAKKLTRRVWD
jgi:hypothetical protein